MWDWSASDYVDLCAYMDGGTVVFRFRNTAKAELVITLGQYMHLEYWCEDVEPGRLYVNEESVPMHSEMERRVKDLLSAVTRLPGLSDIDRSIVACSEEFISSAAYINMAERVEALKREGYPARFTDGRRSAD